MRAKIIATIFLVPFFFGISAWLLASLNKFFIPASDQKQIVWWAQVGAPVAIYLLGVFTVVLLATTLRWLWKDKVSRK